MNQLGMHELAEAVLSRARRRAGGNKNTLVALMLQYQQQGKTDAAFQVANQILRMDAGRHPSSFNPNTPDDSARREAIQVFARSGRLDELIGRAETQLKASPGSFQVLQSLAEYYQVSGDKAKVRETYERQLKVRPDDGELRLLIGVYFLQEGDPAAAIEQFALALRKDPSLYVKNFWQVDQAYRQAGRLEELGKVLDAVDVRPFGSNPYALQQVVGTMLQDEKTRDLGMKLFRKAWKALPEARASLILNLELDALWNLPEVYDDVKGVVIPGVGRTAVSPWSPLDQVTSWDGSRVNGLVTRFLASASKQEKLEELGREVDAGIARFPEWAGGRALRAILLLRGGQLDRARAALTEIIERDGSIPASVRLILGQELEGIRSLREIEIKLYEGAVADETPENALGYQLSPIHRLIAIYHQSGRDAQARDLVLKLARRPAGQSHGNNTGQPALQRLAESLGHGYRMVELGYPVDAARFYNEVLAEIDRQQSPQDGNLNQLAQQASAGLDPGHLRPQAQEPGRHPGRTRRGREQGPGRQARRSTS